MKKSQYKNFLLNFRKKVCQRKDKFGLIFLLILVFGGFFIYSINLSQKNWPINPLTTPIALSAPTLPSPSTNLPEKLGPEQSVGDLDPESALITASNAAAQATPSVPTAPNSSLTWYEKLAQYIAELIPRAILFAVYILCWITYSITYGLVWFSEGMLKLFFDPSFVTSLGGFTTVTFVRNTAQIVADLCNMLYLFILLYIAIGTMFGMSGTSKLLVKLVIAALLTNFSLVISGIIIDFSQVLMHSFFSTGFSESFKPGTKILSDLQSGWGVGESFSAINLKERLIAFLWSSDLMDLINDMIKIFGLIIFSLVLVVTFITITVLLVIRIVALWILLIVSPAAFAANVLPHTERYWKEWLETFTKYAFTGPILVFFLWLAVKASANVSNNSKLAELKNNVPMGTGFVSNLKSSFYVLLAQNTAVIFQLFVLTLIVWAGIIIANKFGIRGAKSFDQLINSTKRVPGNVIRRSAMVSNFVGHSSRVIGDWYSGRKSIQAENLNNQANYVSSTKTVGSAQEAEKLRQKASKKIKTAESVDKWKNRIIKYASLTDLPKSKKLLATYLQKENKEYNDHSESAVEGFWKNRLKSLTGEKKRQVVNAGESNKARVNLLNNDFIEKYNSYIDAKTKAGNIDSNITQKENDLQAAKKLIKDLQSKVTPSYLSNLSKDQKVQMLETQQEQEKNIQYSLNELLQERQSIRNKQNDLLTMAPSLAEMAGTSEDEKKKIKEEFEKIARDETLGTLDSNNFHIARKIGEQMGNRELLINNAKKVGRENKTKEFGDDLWLKDKYAKEVKACTKEIEEKEWSYDQIKEHVKSGYGSPHMRTALFKKLASSSKHFGDLLKELKKDLGSEEKAISYLKERYSEPDVLNALKAVDEEGRKSNNLSQIGRILYDSRIGKLRLATPAEKTTILTKFAKSMDTKAIQKIHEKSFEDDESIQALAEGPDWVKLSKDDKFKGLMTRKVRELFRGKRQKFEDAFTTNGDDSGKEAFLNIMY